MTKKVVKNNPQNFVDDLKKSELSSVQKREVACWEKYPNTARGVRALQHIGFEPEIVVMEYNDYEKQMNELFKQFDHSQSNYKYYSSINFGMDAESIGCVAEDGDAEIQQTADKYYQQMKAIKSSMIALYKEHNDCLTENEWWEGLSKRGITKYDF